MSHGKPKANSMEKNSTAHDELINKYDVDASTLVCLRKI